MTVTVEAVLSSLTRKPSSGKHRHAALPACRYRVETVAGLHGEMALVQARSPEALSGWRLVSAVHPAPGGALTAAAKLIVWHHRRVEAGMIDATAQVLDAPADPATEIEERSAGMASLDRVSYLEARSQQWRSIGRHLAATGSGDVSVCFRHAAALDRAAAGITASPDAAAGAPQ